MAKDEQFTTDILVNIEFEKFEKFLFVKVSIPKVLPGENLRKYNIWENGEHPINFSDTNSFSCQKIICGALKAFSTCNLFSFIVWKSSSIMRILLSSLAKNFANSLGTSDLGDLWFYLRNLSLPSLQLWWNFGSTSLHPRKPADIF